MEDFAPGGAAALLAQSRLFDETIRQRKKDGAPFVKAIANAGIITGIKVVTGAKDMAAHPERK